MYTPFFKNRIKDTIFQLATLVQVAVSLLLHMCPRETELLRNHVKCQISSEMLAAEKVQLAGVSH